MNVAKLRRLRKKVDWLKRTPLHPKWLLQAKKKKIRALRSIQGGFVLDIGCNNRWARIYLDKNVQYLGLDYPPTSVGLYGSQPDLYGDASALPFAPGIFDTVLLFDVLEHLERPELSLLEISKVLKKDGVLFIEVPFIYPMHDEPHDFQRLTTHGLRRDLKASGFQNINISPTLGAVESAGLLACIALSAVLLRSASEKQISILLAPLILLSIPAINIFSWATGKIFPSWHAMPATYWVEANK